MDDFRHLLTSANLNSFGKRAWWLQVAILGIRELLLPRQTGGSSAVDAFLLV